MSDIKLFRFTSDAVTELEGHSVSLEKSLQELIERNLEAFLGVRFLGSEYSTGKKQPGRIDTLGIDENGCPVIIEYKRSLNENVINQGLFYLDWLLDHKGEFELSVMKRYGQEAADGIEWSAPRLLCIAGGYTKYDVHAVQQMNRNIELFRYKRYGDELLLLELVNATSGTVDPGPTESTSITTVSQYLEKADTEVRDRFESLKAYLLALGDDVQLKTLKHYFAFKRIRNFACVEVHPQNRALTVLAKADPETAKLENGFTRDIRKIGHLGTGDLEITIRSDSDLERAKPLILESYEAS